MKAVVLAAGEGIRLRPLTLTRPKHLIPVGGKPLLEHLLLSLKAADVDEALIVVHYMADNIQQFFGNGVHLGMKLEYIVQKQIGGTADATGMAENYAKEDFLLVYGDLHITSNVIKRIIRSYEKEKPVAAMTVVPVENPEQYGIVELDGPHVIDIIEKPQPKEAPTNSANAGVYILQPGIFKKIRQTSKSSRGEWEITDSLRLLIQEDKKSVLAVEVPSGEWLDVGRPWDLFEANQRALNQVDPIVEGEIEEGAHLIGSVAVGRQTRIRSGAYIEGPAYIGEHSDIGPNCYIRPHTSIGKNVRIGNACEIKNSIIMDSAHIGHLSYVGDSIIGEECNLGAGTITANYRFDADTIEMIIKDEVVDTERTKLGVIFGDRVKTGINSLFMPGIKVSNNSWIGPNIIVYHDVPPNTVLLLKQETEQKESRK
jgi:bifunctional UDP-N-acetylglucosamine pyrophosphorylase/glucosamine-1-phosphate N-acetyltransferase